MQLITLTVQSTGNKKYRLGISKSDSKSIFDNKRHYSTTISFDGKIVHAKTTCGFPNKKGFDLYNKIISDWIYDNKFHNYKPYKPTKLEFYWEKKQNKIYLDFCKKVNRS